MKSVLNCVVLSYIKLAVLDLFAGLKVGILGTKPTYVRVNHHYQGLGVGNLKL